MTDNEIIKALKIHANRGDCGECAYGELPSCNCQMQMFKDCLSLINRQKAEIAKLEAEIDKQYEQAEADILGNMSDGGTSCHWCIEQNRAKAIKELAKRMNEEAEKVCIDREGDFVEADGKTYDTVADWCKETSDNIVKEMVGDSK